MTSAAASGLQFLAEFQKTCSYCFQLQVQDKAKCASSPRLSLTPKVQALLIERQKCMDSAVLKKQKIMKYKFSKSLILLVTYKIYKRTVTSNIMEKEASSGQWAQFSHVSDLALTGKTGTKAPEFCNSGYNGESPAWFSKHLPLDSRYPFAPQRMWAEQRNTFLTRNAT